MVKTTPMLIVSEGSVMFGFTLRYVRYALATLTTIGFGIALN